jgi:hypothetical protein
MIILLNLGRALMVAWIAYALLLMFAPGLLHRPADPIGGAIQALIAFGMGYFMDRALSFVLRRRALSDQSDPSERDGGTI